MPQCRRGRHKHGKRTQGPDDGSWVRVRDVRIAHGNERAGHHLSVQLFPAARQSRRPSTPGFPVVRARWTRISPPEAPKWSNLHEWSREGASLPASRPQVQPAIGTPRFPQLKPPTIQRGRRLFSCVGWSIGPFRATLGLKRPTTTASHQDPRRVHPCPSR